jgi:hypothetical protein
VGGLTGVEDEADESDEEEQNKKPADEDECPFRCAVLRLLLHGALSDLLDG